MDRDYIEANQVIERYLLDRLSAAEADEFEQAFLIDPDLQRELEATRELMLGLRAAQRDGSLDDLQMPAANDAADDEAGGPNMRLLGLAAAMLAAIGLATWQQRQATPSAGPVMSSLPVLQVRLPRVRSAVDDGVVTRVFVQSDDQVVTLAPDLTPAVGERRYRLMQGDRILLSGPLGADQAGVTARAGDLPFGDTLALVVSDSGGEQTYRFTLAPAPAN